jgi:urocanate hydratase
MAVQNCIGDAMRGATWVALHNGGGCGWGEVMNGGFGLVLDGTAEAAFKADSMLNWDVSNGVARRSWSGNENAKKTIDRAMARNNLLQVTMPHAVLDISVISRAVDLAKACSGSS